MYEKRSNTMNMQRTIRIAPILLGALCLFFFGTGSLVAITQNSSNDDVADNAKAKKSDGIILSYEEIAETPSIQISHGELFQYSTTPSQSITGKELVIRGNILPVLCVPRILDSAELRVVLDLGEEYRLGKNLATTASLTIDIVGYTGLPGSTTSIAMVTRCTLQVGGNTPEQMFRVNITNQYTNIRHFAVYVVNYTGTTQATVQSALRLTLSCPVQWRTGGRNILTDATYPYSAPARITTLSPGGNTINDNPVTFTWGGIGCEAAFPLYQVQILRLYNTTTSSVSETDIVAEIDWSKALTVETASTSLTLTLAEGRGYYVWRARPIGNYEPGGITNPLNWGVWTAVPTVDPTDGMLHLSSPVVSPNCVFFYEQFDDDKNWIFSRTFTENAKISEGMIYANGLQMSEQKQQRLFSQASKVITQTVYDYAGRDVLSSLAVPYNETSGSTSNALHYVGRSAIMSYNGARYSAEHFDKQSSSTVFQPLPINGGALYNYYTASGSSAIPNAEGYPYTRILQYSDGSGRVSQQSNAGNTHRMGAGHTSRTFYTAAIDQELVRLFGDEAPEAQSVSKVIRYDPNTTGTVEYISKEGKVIATALVAGSDNEPLENLDDTEIFANGSVTDYILDYSAGQTKNVRMGKTLRAGKTLVLTEPGDVTLDYELKLQSFANSCMDVCLWCDYNVYFKIFNTEDNSIVFKDSLIISPGSLLFNEKDCTPSQTETKNKTVFLQPGSYRIERSISSDNVVASEGLSYLQWHKKKLEEEIRSRFDALNGGDGLSYILNTFLSDTSSRPLQDMYSFLNEHGGLTLRLSGCENESITILERACPQTKCEQGNLDFESFLIEKLGQPEKLGSHFGSHKAYWGLDTLSWGMFNVVIQNMLGDGYSCDQLWDCWENAVETKAAMSDPAIADAYSQSGQNFNLLDAFLDCTGRKFLGVKTDREIYLGRPYAYFRDGSGDSRYNDCYNAAFIYAPDSTELETLYKCWTNENIPADKPTSQGAAINELRDSCHSMCNYRRASFRREVIRTFRELNPFIDTTSIPVDCIVDSVVKNCHMNCNKLQPGLPEWVYKEIVSFISSGFDFKLPSSTVPACPAGYNLIGRRQVTPAMLWPQINAINAVLLSYQDSIFQFGPTPQLKKSLDSILLVMIYELIKESPNCLGNVVIAPAQYVYTMRIMNQIMTLWQQGMLQSSRVQLYLDGCRLEMRTGTYVKSGCLYELDKDTVIYSPPTDPAIGNNPCIVSVPPSNETIVLCDNMCVWSTGCSICVHWIEPSEITTSIVKNKHEFRPKTCREDFAPEIKADIQRQLQAIIERQQRLLVDGYGQKCSLPEQLQEKFSVKYKMRLYHYTLYYYDRGGNLVRTVPPAGVVYANSRVDQPAHTYVTKYKYNSLQQLVWQQTPDGGVTEFIYNDRNQLRLSRNARQAVSPLRYSYTKYDALSRIIEVGETQASSYPSNLDDVGSGSYPTSSLSERTLTYYSSPESGTTYLGDGTTVQSYLQNRVSYSVSDGDGNLGTTNDQVKTVYSYDPHGNVKWLKQEVSGAAAKYLRYEYDLHSGNVVRLLYNENREDRFCYRYEYDEDNRIVRSYSSRDGYIWENDARYNYYAHGPRSRRELGEDRLQGIDYVYTIHGWLKALNHPSLDPANDPSGDGNSSGPNSSVARDVFGMVLGYYKGDFNKSSSAFHSISSDKLWDNSRPQGGSLYNGNIANWVTKTGSSAGSTQYANQQTGYVYRYDRAGRLKSEGFRYESSGWQTPGAQQYNTGYSYDPNSNIKTLYRYANSGMMDQFTYSYYGTGSTATNRLKQVSDAVSSGTYSMDIDNQTSPTNYSYDGTGNLTGDASEGLTIEWTVYGKVKQVTHSSGKVIKFLYDAGGNRVRKEVTGSGVSAENGTTYYVLEPTGKQLAMYNWNGQSTDSVEVEYTLYGSERLGQRREVFNAGDRNVLITNIAAREDIHNSGVRYSRIINRSIYELNDHLGNVRVVISDVKELQTGGWYAVDVKSYSNYYAFGMEQPERCWQSEEYRYGFNGKEKDNELKGEGNSYDFGARIYDPRLGRWLSMDPKAEQRRWLSPYNFVQNNPLILIDPDGMLDRIYQDYETGEELGKIEDGVEGTIRITKTDFDKLKERYDKDIANGDQEKLPLYNEMIERYSLGKVGYDIAQTAMSYEGSEDWDYEVKKGNFGEKSYKCNKFVQDVLAENGVAPATAKEWPPLARAWATPSVKIRKWTVVSQPNLGDVIAGSYNYADASGHVVIVTGIDLETGYITTMGTVHSNYIGDNGYGNNMVNNEGNHDGKVYGPISIRRYKEK
jgi:RHS repeat-associated protein